MAYIDWNESYSVGVKTMDDQHKKLIGMINQLHDAMKEGKGSSEIGSVLSGLSDYTKYHFTAEEKLLKENNYPMLLIQENRHKEFITKLDEFQKDVSSKNLAISLKVRDFLRDWLINHISGEDKKYMKYLNDKGIN
ncbi:bacteriohemerythrin [Leptolinea tardivitalis]|uniref:Hemerythrin n=1 Tax=Leptolinea tardivitalis TaxID=229920 RepID=A0A0P6XPV7_9CHLR|nr:bacteriohemerythrin [Leptolinea tardivitalis]KPL71308.1 hemerythrin [Leptolinea tardivitalis]GAP23081.1 protein containing hemerythrin-like metal-binding domain [Leptolinea tardivitalis]